MRVRLDGYFAHYELQAWTELGPGHAGSRQLDIRDLDEARSLLRRLLWNDPGFSLRSLLAELGEGYGYGSYGHDRDELIECLAESVVRGRLIIERHPIEIMASHKLEVYELEPPAPSFEGNEFEDEHRVIHWLIATPPAEIRVDSVPEEPPSIKLGSVPEPPPSIKIGSVPEEPPSIKLGSVPEPPPSIKIGSDWEPAPQLTYGGELGG